MKTASGSEENKHKMERRFTSNSWRRSAGTSPCASISSCQEKLIDNFERQQARLNENRSTADGKKAEKLRQRSRDKEKRNVEKKRQENCTTMDK